MNQIEELFGLFQNLNHSVNEYIFSCKAYKTALKISSESEENTEEDADRKMQFSYDETKKILAEISKLFDDEPREFSPVSEEIKIKIDEESMKNIYNQNLIHLYRTALLEIRKHLAVSGSELLGESIIEMILKICS